MYMLALNKVSRRVHASFQSIFVSYYFITLAPISYMCQSVCIYVACRNSACILLVCILQTAGVMYYPSGNTVN